MTYGLSFNATSTPYTLARHNFYAIGRASLVDGDDLFLVNTYAERHPDSGQVDISPVLIQIMVSMFLYLKWEQILTLFFFHSYYFLILYLFLLLFFFYSFFIPFSFYYCSIIILLFFSFFILFSFLLFSYS